MSLLQLDSGSAVAGIRFSLRGAASSAAIAKSPLQLVESGRGQLSLPARPLIEPIRARLVRVIQAVRAPYYPFYDVPAISFQVPHLLVRGIASLLPLHNGRHLLFMHLPVLASPQHTQPDRFVGAIGRQPDSVLRQVDIMDALQVVKGIRNLLLAWRSRLRHDKASATRRFASAAISGSFSKP